MWRIYVYKDKIFLLASMIGSFASVLGVIISLLISSQNVLWWVLVLIAVAFVFFVLMVLATIIVLKSDTPTQSYPFDDKARIREYLFAWIKSGGRVAIWTRDMSWVDDEEMVQMLRRKAQAHEVILCLPKEIDKSDDLKQHGAEVFAYGTLEAPESRFTIVNYGQAGSRVAMGRRRDNRHIIQEFSGAEEHPAFYMARDLVRLVQERNNAGE